MRRLLILLLVLGISGCELLTAPAQPDPGVDVGESDQAERVLATDRRTYAAGAEAVLLLTNTFEHELGFNLCFSTLERQANGGWIRAEFQQDGACTAELRILAPGRTASYRFRLDPRLPAGEYRFRTTLENMSAGTREDHASNSFAITR